MPDHFAASPIPRYLQVADVLRQRIARGQWPEGHRLPSLEELVAEFDVARVTLRKAVEMLSRDGLVRARQGRGTFVTGTPKPGRPISVVTTLDQLARVYRDTQPKIVNIDESITSPPLRPGEGTAAEHYVFMRRVHSHAGEPYCVINIYLDQDVFRRSPKRFRDQTVIPILTTMKSVHIADANQVLTIGTADMQVARLLGLPVNAPVAEVRRIFKDPDGKVIYLGEVTYRGDAIHLEMNLKP
ncbi:MAG: GntR family transcriptional regulator [Gammaproteobacteria bacterium]|nr:GntR family transcriptional regulator [Gammaproteobacteria bacterium]MBU2284946.1 GntR family transcriptional regulator [Gammaproteobacteria bacterium]